MSPRRKRQTIRAKTRALNAIALTKTTKIVVCQSGNSVMAQFWGWVADMSSVLTTDLRAFLGERRYAVLATHDPDGGIHLTPIWFLFEEDLFHFACSSRSRKVKNLERRAAASVVVEARRPGQERWVSASGSVAVLRGDEARASHARI